MRAVRIVVVLPETWQEIVTSIIRTDERLRIVASYDSHPDPLGAARDADADFLITMEAEQGALEHAGSRPAIVLVEESGRTGRVLRFRSQSEPLHALSGATLVSSLAAMSTR